MATYRVRGSSHDIVYPYKTENGERKQQWEAYTSGLEATQRKAYIEYLQKNRDFDGLLKAVNEYKEKKSVERNEQYSATQTSHDSKNPVSKSTDNLKKCYEEFALKWLPIHARLKRLSPKTYNEYYSSLTNHAIPYFGDRVMSTITANDIDDFVDYLTKKPCKGAKSYNKSIEEIPKLSSASVRRHYTIFKAGFLAAKRWGYITEIPQSTAPTEKQKKRRAWEYKKVYDVLSGIKDKNLHLAVHFAFVCSLRAGETAGIDIKTIDLKDRSFWIMQEMQRVTDKSLEVLPQNEIIRIFPKEIKHSKSNLVLKPPKTDASRRKQFLTTQLLQEIKERLEEIQRNKLFFGKEYKDYNLLICKPDGRPCDPTSFNNLFKLWQTKLGIDEDEQIEFQGLRKSGQMHKVRISQNNYQLVAENGGQSPEVLMSNYNETLEHEKRALLMLVEKSFYPSANNKIENDQQDVAAILQAMQDNPQLSKQILQLLQNNAVNM